jgi:FkbM family methyltransferase
MSTEAAVDLATLDDLSAAYRIFLNRAPDKHGFSHYASKISAGWRLSQLREAFLNSEEYRGNEHPIQVAIGDDLYVSIDKNEPEFGRAIALDHTWERHIVQLISRNLNPNDVFIDVGGNVGVMSFNAARKVGEKGKVIVFEPNPVNAARFVEGIKINGFRNVILHQIALSNEVKIMSLSGGSNAFLSENRTDRLVQSLPGDLILENEPRVDFIKLDIEGYEPFAIEGLHHTLGKHKPLLLCEFNPRCLKSHASVDPSEFAKQIFCLTAELEAIEHNGSSNKVKSASDLLSLWENKNKRAASANFLPDGMLHLDLFFKID